MSNITSVLGNEPGIQYDRPNDKTGGTGTAPINNVIVGSFKRGRTDKLMDITKRNLRARLGFDPKNPFYVAVQDALDTNISSVKVLRVVTDNDDGGEGGHNFSCAGATNSVKWLIAVKEGTTPPPDLKYIIDGVDVTSVPSPPEWLNIEILAEDYPLITPAGYQTGHGVYQWKNQDSRNHRLEIQSNDPNILVLMYDNPTAFQDFDKRIGRACLAPKPPEVGISCVGATNTFKLALHYETSNAENLIQSVMDAFTFIANGLTYDFIPSFLERNIALFTDPSNPALYIRAEATFKNNSSQNVRLKLIKKPTSMMLYDAPSNLNPTLQRDENSNFTVCMSPEVAPPVIPDLGDIDDSNTNDGWGYVNIHTDSAVGRTTPTFTRTSSLSGPVVITTAASFVGQTISPLNAAYTLNPDTPIAGLPLELADTPNFIPKVQLDGEVLGLGGGYGSGGWDSPVSVLFDKNVSAVVITGGYFNNEHSTYIKCFDRMGNVIGVASNKALGIDDYGFSSGEEAKIAGFSFYINSLEDAGFGLRTIKFL